MNYKQFDLIITGGGIAGLMLAKKALEQGFSVALVEKNTLFAKSPTTKNEGWLHRGTYHAFGIIDAENALNVAKRCIYGFDQIKGTYPVCFEEPFTESYAFLKNPNKIDLLIDRWNQAGISFSPVSKSQAQKKLPEVDLKGASHIFSVRETAINTQILLDSIYNQISWYQKIDPPKISIITSADLLDIDASQGRMLVKAHGQKHEIGGNFFVYCAGYGTKSIFKKYLGLELPIRVFRGHMMVTPRLSKHNVFYLDKGEITAMNHGKATIIGATRDNDEVFTSSPEPDPEKVQKLLQKTRELFTTQFRKNCAYACAKADWSDGKRYQSLSPTIKEPLKNHFVAMPGKMTEAPYICDVIIREIFSRSNRSMISKRPCDHFETPNYDGIYAMEKN